MNLQTMDSLVEKLRCGICNNYLLWPPIVLLKDGTSACGKCTPSLPPKNPDGSVVRELTFEQALRKLSFPCQYKSEGCPERLFFGYLNHNEQNCGYRPFTCPTGNCPWSGSMFGLLKHFAETHSAIMKNALSFKLRVDQDSEEIILAVIEKVPFIIKYTYNADQAKLFMEINCLTIDQIVYKIVTFNDFFNDNGVSLKKKRCLPYISQSWDGVTLNLNKYMPILKKSHWIMINVEMVIEKKGENDAIVPTNPAGVPVNGIIGALKHVCAPLVPRPFPISKSISKQT